MWQIAILGRGWRMEYLKKERGADAKRALQRAILRFGNPIVTDKPKPYPKNPVKDEDMYWVFVCKKCSGKMHAVYVTVNGVRYMCASCGNLGGET